MTVCIVGNSDNILGSRLGSKIDQCTTVIRINDFLVAGHEEDAGTKTDVIACAFSSANKLANDPNWPTKPLLKKCSVWMVRYPRPDRLSRVRSCGVNPSDVVNPSQSLYDKLVADVYSKFWRKEPSSGLVTIAMAMELFPGEEIFICGFDNNTGKEGKKHYFDPSFFDVDLPNDPVGHDWESESHYIQELVDQDKIKRLT